MEPRVADRDCCAQVQENLLPLVAVNAVVASGEMGQGMKMLLGVEALGQFVGESHGSPTESAPLAHCE